MILNKSLPNSYLIKCKSDFKTVVSIRPHEAFYTRVMCEKSRLAQKSDAVSGIFIRLIC